MDISGYRPPCPTVYCNHCGRKADKVESSALHFGMPPTKHGVLLIQVKCHGKTQNIACGFKWLMRNADKRITAFSPVIEDFGLREMVELDGFSLPTELEACRYQLAVGEHGTVPPTNWPYKDIDERFVRAIQREAEKLKGIPELGTLTAALSTARQAIDALILRSYSQMVETADITEATGLMAAIAMKIFEQIGTPKTRPTQNIHEALPNPLSGTEHDLPMSGPTIALKPADDSKLLNK